MHPTHSHQPVVEEPREKPKKKTYSKRKILLGIKLDRSIPPPITVHGSLFKLPAVIVAASRRNSGKTTAVASLLRTYKDAGHLDRCWLISPNCDSEVNKKLFHGVVEPEDMRKEATIGAFCSVLSELEQDAEEFRKYQRALIVWRKIQPYLHRKGPLTDDAANDIPADLLLEAHELDVIEHPPVSQWRGDWPVNWVVLDDVQSSPLMIPSTGNPLMSACIRNRHLFGIGCSFIICVQNYSCQTGLPRAIRENATVYLIWRQASEERRLQLAHDLGNDVNSKEFLSALDAATKDGDEHDFLTIDMENRDPGKRFRKCFDKYIIVSPEDIASQNLQTSMQPCRTKSKSKK